MFDKVHIIFLVGLTGLLIIVLELVRRKKLKEEYSLLWIFTVVVLLTLLIWRGSLKLIAHALGIFYPPNALFVIGSMFILAILLHFSVVISSFKRKQQELAQQFALLNLRLEQLEKVENPDLSRQRRDEAGAVENDKE
ncbi:DUF2304 domain-containing protein [Candidatus Poribacteria bacterium]|nr:DUF2304 domain-containing protein [Candidatus Poribacteria bacterium]